MRKTVIIFLVMILSISVLISGCGRRKDDKETPTDDIPKVTKYDLEKYTLPYWEGEVVYNETAIVLEDEEGNIPDITLMYPIQTIVCVFDYALKTEYNLGVDYDIQDGKLVIKPEGAIKRIKHNEFFPKVNSEKSWHQVGGGYRIRTEANKTLNTLGLGDWQIAVTYTHDKQYNWEEPEDKSNKFSSFNNKLFNLEQLNIVCIGDSISTGASSSGFAGMNPFTPDYFNIFIDKLKKTVGQGLVSEWNMSVGGTESPWGVEMIPEINKKNPDLLIIGFGMNDGVWMHPSQYASNIAAMIEGVRRNNPQTEIVLIATMLPNEYVGYERGSSVLKNHNLYLNKLIELESLYDGVAVCDMTTPSNIILERKRYEDISSNNINHPNDFFHRLYAQVLIRTVLG